ncbi:hydrolase, TatD family [Anaerococcus hydrogenalis DSM 7454]|uniref:Hydrolase, TatD family n=1 Tax=Anaerococcus hydrogenalis DSM 7454 TaxID=561177 RepID=B6W7P2_9FIRM|nr:TatD family hydrolase [Anaerococcus hydrogenalis]EEB36571.1 hydrolase, TatD family [Anaerococcus hydrogenalis DSM 7454]
MKLIDSHAHLTSDNFNEDRSFLIKDLSNFAVNCVIIPSSNLENSYKAVELSESFDNLYAQVGFHPENIESFDETSIEKLENLAKNPKVVAIGEIGLDYYWKDDNKAEQKDVFIKQLDLAKKLNLPVVVHSRDSIDDCLEILKAYPELKVQIHCFAYSYMHLMECMKRGYYISIGGVVTFKNAENEKNAAINVDLDKLMLETDSPYLSPEPYRGRRNDPRKIVEVAREIANLRGMKLSKIAKRTSKNAKEFFNIK